MDPINHRPPTARQAQAAGRHATPGRNDDGPRNTQPGSILAFDQHHLRLSPRQVEGIERKAYTDGWNWGLVSGLIAGCCTGALAVWLLSVAIAAAECATC